MTSRRGFIGRLIGGTAAAAVAPKLLTDPVKQAPRLVHFESPPFHFLNATSTAFVGDVVSWTDKGDVPIGVCTKYDPESGTAHVLAYGPALVRTTSTR